MLIEDIDILINSLIVEGRWAVISIVNVVVIVRKSITSENCFRVHRALTLVRMSQVGSLNSNRGTPTCVHATGLPSLA